MSLFKSMSTFKHMYFFSNVFLIIPEKSENINNVSLKDSFAEHGALTFRTSMTT